MKNYLFISIACSLLLCCHHEQNEPIIPEEPEPEVPYVMPCGCGDEWPQEETNCDRDLPWDYPVGTEEWNSPMSWNERNAFCQIPDEVLTSISTYDLIEMCLLYPLFMESTFSSNTFELGLNALFRTFNGVRELFLREDVAKELLKKYRCMMQKQNLSILDEPTTSDSEKGFYSIITWYVEILLSRYQSSDDSKDEYMEIVRHLFCGYEKKLMYPEIFSFRTNFYTRAIMLVKIDRHNILSIPFGYANRIFERGLYDDPTIHAINNLSCQYLNR